ncbi:m-AAA protease-interacting protein 1, mitochondrial-like [Ornithodoros turicata]|uniref:m-AAA protease-interacting protein 1, mitochondrial-like n=1 Tax=Ornithodoros turicata TaxID=34597 RepID=UPI0031396102
MAAVNCVVSKFLQAQLTLVLETRPLILSQWLPPSSYTSKRNSHVACRSSATAFRRSPPINSVHLRRSVQDIKNNVFALSLSKLYSTEVPSQGPQLMDFPAVTWPSLVLSIKNWIQATFIIKPYLDSSFNQLEFLHGAKQAVAVVSDVLSSGDLKSLTGLVTNDALPEIQRNLSLLNVRQRQNLVVRIADIYFCFLYQIGIIMDDNSQRRYVEATVVYHYIPGLAEARAKEKPIADSMSEVKDLVYVANYRFIREYTKGVQSDWTINRLNHFKLHQE